MLQTDVQAFCDTLKLTGGQMSQQNVFIYLETWREHEDTSQFALKSHQIYLLQF